MRYEGPLYRPPSEANSLILQATIGCSHNLCTYCHMYRGKNFRLRELQDILADLDQAAKMSYQYRKLFIADGDALILPQDHWRAVLTNARQAFPELEQVSCYARSRNLLDKSSEELKALASWGLNLLYLGPESGDAVTLKNLVKGETPEEHVAAAQKARTAGFEISLIVLLGAGGVERSSQHAAATAELISAMDPHYLAALTLMVVPGTPLARQQEKGRFELPSTSGMLEELHCIVERARPTDALFRTNHASNYLPLAGRLPRDRERLLQVLEDAMAGHLPLRPDWTRGL